METAQSVRDAFDLTGRVALVTGAGGGIGRASAEVLAGAGATVVCADIDPAGAAETATTILEAGGRAEGAEIDVSVRGAAATLVGHITARHGALHVMCNIAGMMIDSSIIDLDPDEFERILAVNLKGVVYGCQAAGKAMVEGGGKHGVRVNCVAPGFVPTNMTARYYTNPDGSVNEEAKAAVVTPMVRSAPLRRVGTTADIAYCVLYLASDASSFLTGQLLSPNGGVSMHY